VPALIHTHLWVRLKAYPVVGVNKAWLPLSAHAEGNAFKLYVFDTGLLGALGGLSPRTMFDCSFGSYKGYVAENFALQEMTAADIAEIVCWREQTAEVEFLLEHRRDGAHGRSSQMTVSALPRYRSDSPLTGAVGSVILRSKYHGPSYVCRFGSTWNAWSAPGIATARPHHDRNSDCRTHALCFSISVPGAP